MKPIWWLLFSWFAPLWTLLVLYLKLWIAIITLLVRLFVWICQGILTLTGKAIRRVELYWKTRQTEQIEEVEL